MVHTEGLCEILLSLIGCLVSQWLNIWIHQAVSRATSWGTGPSALVAHVCAGHSWVSHLIELRHLSRQGWWGEGSVETLVGAGGLSSSLA